MVVVGDCINLNINNLDVFMYLITLVLNIDKSRGYRLVFENGKMI